MHLLAFGPDIWTADGPAVTVFGPLALPTRMIVVRLRDGSLWINSPIEASPDEMDRLTQLGRVRHLVAPTPLHAWRLAAWKKHFPDTLVWSPALLEARTPRDWVEEIDQTMFQGNLFLTEAEFFHRASRTLIMTDFLQNYAPLPGRPVRNALTRLAHVQGGGVPIDIRLSITRRALARRSLMTILSWDFDKLIVAHGDCVEAGAKAFVRSVFDWLL
ncbi:MAG: DUF4336 domain-containing protein [Candidatus Aquilonibacter sp.]